MLAGREWDGSGSYWLSIEKSECVLPTEAEIHLYISPSQQTQTANADQAVASSTWGRAFSEEEREEPRGGRKLQIRTLVLCAAFPPLPSAARNGEREGGEKKKRKKHPWLGDAVCRHRCLSRQCKIRSLNAAKRCLKTDQPAKQADISQGSGEASIYLTLSSLFLIPINFITGEEKQVRISLSDLPRDTPPSSLPHSM